MRVQLDDETLRQVSEITQGRYFQAESGEDLTDVYEELSAQFVMEQEEMEITAGFAGLAGILMLLAGGLSLLWFNRIL